MRRDDHEKDYAAGGDVLLTPPPPLFSSYKLTRSLLPPLSHTRFKDLGPSSTLPGRRLVLLRPFTGYTHQLRVTLKALGAPIVGGGGEGGKGGGEEGRLLLHAVQLRINNAKLGVGEEEVVEVLSKPDFLDSGEWERVQKEMSEGGKLWSL